MNVPSNGRALPEPRLRLKNADGDSWDDPSEDEIRRRYAWLNLNSPFLVMERLDVPPTEAGEHYLQLGLEDDLGMVVEYREGGPADHYRASVAVPGEQGGDEIVIPVLLGWAAGRPGWRDRLAWVRWDVERERPWDA